MRMQLANASRKQLPDTIFGNHVKVLNGGLICFEIGKLKPQKTKAPEGAFARNYQLGLTDVQEDIR